MAITKMQRVDRLHSCFENKIELFNELENAGRQGWDPIHQPDWLLFEIENNILIRQVQARIAREMLSPSSGANAIMQLNMGEGKSSVIVPIVAAALANKEKLVRIVVLRPLKSQMFQVLLRTLSGMLGRRIVQMPISRSIQMDHSRARQVQLLCEAYMHDCGVLLVQPEHLLSFELMGLEYLSSRKVELDKTLIETQRWLEHNARDILDEGDEIFECSLRTCLHHGHTTNERIRSGSVDGHSARLRTCESIRTSCCLYLSRRLETSIRRFRHFLSHANSANVRSHKAVGDSGAGNL